MNSESCRKLLKGDLTVIRAGYIWWVYLWDFYCLQGILCLFVNCRWLICKLSLVWERLIDFFPPYGKTSLTLTANWTRSCYLAQIVSTWQIFNYSRFLQYLAAIFQTNFSNLSSSRLTALLRTITWLSISLLGL